MSFVEPLLVLSFTYFLVSSQLDILQGKTFSIWKLSDLAVGKENSAVTFFLFGDVYKEYWKMAEGNVIALLNAAIMPQRDVSPLFETGGGRLRDGGGGWCGARGLSPTIFWRSLVFCSITM